jgi:hypothetical protein
MGLELLVLLFLPVGLVLIIVEGDAGEWVSE